MREWENHFRAMEMAAEEACRSHRKRMDLPIEDEEDVDCVDRVCSQGCPLMRESQDD